MCGIVGFTGERDDSLLRAMNNSQIHRGPDDEGYFAHNGVNMAMRRLSILDIAGGHQPMENYSGLTCIVFNGEIFNAPDLRKQVENKYPFKTDHSDTEVLLALYDIYGTEMLSLLDGMFAFVIYDKTRNQLFGARDPAGIKPLYYSTVDSNFTFASELKSLLQLPKISKAINLQSLYDYVSFQFVPSPMSILKDVQKLSPGAYFEFNLASKQLDVKKYWSLSIRPNELQSESEWHSIIREELRAAVKRWTLSDVPVACSLSGGLDSSTIVGLFYQSGLTDLHTYSLGIEGADEGEYNELAFAREIAQKWGTKHHEFLLNPETVLSDLPAMAYHLDEPYGGGLPSWYIYKMMKGTVKVCLTGTGGDELFGNYGKYRYFEKTSTIRRTLSIIKNAGGTSIANLWFSLKNPNAYFFWKYCDDFTKRKTLFNPDIVNEVSPTEVMIEREWRKTGLANARDIYPLMDFQYQLPEEFLHVTDRFSMAHSIEARVPFCDRVLIEKVFQIPARLRTSASNPKSFLKDTVSDLIPPHMLNSRKKGFILPLQSWTRDQLKPMLWDVFDSGYLKSQGLFSPLLWERLIGPHLEKNVDKTQLVWTLLMFQIWYGTFIEKTP